MAEGEAAPEAEAPKKKGMKGMIIKIVPLLLVALVVAKMTVLKPPPLTSEQKKTKAAVAERTLEIKCSLANSQTPPLPLDPKTGHPMPTDKQNTPPTTAEPVSDAGPILTMDSVTVNLAGDGSHFLKMGVGFQMPPKTVIDTVKTDNPGTPALSYLISVMRTKTMDDLQKPLEPLREQLGYQICVNPALNDGGSITTIYFADFVAQ